MQTGRFITFEGVDGAGKSTCVEWARQWFDARRVPVTVTREPGGTALGEAIRQLLLAPGEGMRAETEVLLLFAARNEHVHRVVRPALDAGHWVLCDRFLDATLAYQGGGRDVPAARILALAEWLHPGLVPSATFLVDTDVDTASARIRQRGPEDRFEAEAVEFHRHVALRYRALAAESRGRIRVIDGSRPKDEVRMQLERDLASL